MALYLIERKRKTGIASNPLEYIEYAYKRRIDDARLCAERYVWQMHDDNGTRDSDRAWSDMKAAQGISPNTVQLSCATVGQVVFFRNLSHTEREARKA